MIRNKLKSATPDPIWRAASEVRYAFNRLALWPSATFHPVRRLSINRLAAMKDIHHDQRCFIIGNGPSLRSMDLSHLKDEYTFGMNRIYMMFPELGFTTSYYLCVNSMVVEQCAEDIRSLEIPRFISWRSRNLILQEFHHETNGETTNTSPDHNRMYSSALIFLHTTYTGPRFAEDARGRIWEGATVTNVALQLAYHMGFKQSILIGVDHNYTTQGKPNTTVISEGADPNHFNSNYFGKGFRWQLPDLDTSEKGYMMARIAYEKAGREVIDATAGGKLTIFKKVNYDRLF